ncbi:MAG TPA: sigma-70 region 4 domain-containing protein [Sphingomonadaceae bacterium]
MTDEPDPQLRERAWRALERSLAPVALPRDQPADPELLARIEAALLTLPRRRREIFLAVRLDGTSYAGLAERTGLSVREVEREVARAIAHIDHCLERGGAVAPRPWWRRWFG